MGRKNKKAKEKKKQDIPPSEGIAGEKKKKQDIPPSEGIAGEKKKKQVRQDIPSILTECITVGKKLACNHTFLLHPDAADNSRILILDGLKHTELSAISVHTSDVSDISLFSDVINNVASASVKGRINVSHLSLDHNHSVNFEFQVTIDIIDHAYTAQPRVCWHSKKTEILFVGWRAKILKLNTQNLRKKKRLQLIWLVEHLIPGIEDFGQHASEVTDLSTCSWMDLLVSSGVDGKVKVWSTDTSQLLYELDAYDNGPVGFASFIRPFHNPSHTLLVTRGLVSGEICFWASRNEENWLLDTNSPTLLNTHNIMPSIDNHYTQVAAIRDSGILIVAYPELNEVYLVFIEEENEGRSCRARYRTEFTPLILNTPEDYIDITGKMIGEVSVDVRQLYKTTTHKKVYVDLHPLSSRDWEEIKTIGFFPIGTLASTESPNCTHFVGNLCVYNIDSALKEKVVPQLVDTDIAKYDSDSKYDVGRLIAVSEAYLCYCLKEGDICVHKFSNASTSLLKGHHTILSDIAFFKEDVHLLASASVDGKFCVWKLHNDKDKAQTVGDIIVAIQVEGGGDTMHPLICWHCEKQEVLVVSIGARILMIDITKVGNGEAFSAERPLKFHVDKLTDGVRFVGMHEGEVTDLSMCQWVRTLLVSASTDGSIKIWENCKAVQLLSFQPHDGSPVSSATFLRAPNRVNQVILITGGSLNGEIRLWASDDEEISDAILLKCIQTLELRSSSEPEPKESFYNQVVAFSQPGFLLVSNAKKNTIHAVHIEYGFNQSSTRMDYIVEFSVSTPILCFAGTSDMSLNFEHILQLYCIHPKAVRKYPLHMSLCYPPRIDDCVLPSAESPITSAPREHDGDNQCVSDLVNEQTGDNHTYSSTSSHIHYAQEMRTQLLAMQRESRERIATMVTGVKINSDELLARFRREIDKNEKDIEECLNEITKLTEKTLKENLTAAVTSLKSAMMPEVEKTISAVLKEIFKREAGELLQTRMLAIGRKAVQEALKTSLETTVVAPFEFSCKEIIDEMEENLKKKMNTFETEHSALVSSLKNVLDLAAHKIRNLAQDQKLLVF